MQDLATVVRLQDYKPYPFQIESLALDFDINDEATLVKNTMVISPNPDSRETTSFLELHGEELELVALSLNDKVIPQGGYQIKNNVLSLEVPEGTFTVELVNKIKPSENTALSGLYQSGPMFCTQCEAEGFRRITFFPDRPDVMTRFTTTIHADRKKYPVLLSNGNLVGQGLEDNNKHWVKWSDPSLKPCYLFALVAGNLMAVEDSFVTCSGRLVTLKLFIERENLEKTGHAMKALKKAMAWDEATYGREYDLDIYMVVATNDFNMGAMENKGLNIFNSAYVLAQPETATDTDYLYIDDVVAHEYFHNWSGNRVTCRDWFQLSLKEGLTVFREHHYSEEASQSPVTRIDQVRLLRTRQFAEDASPMAHPVQPDEYLEINNFYTLTIYEKGAEVIRMMKILLGEENFSKGLSLYFERHDGQAVTIEEFVKALEEASGVDLTQFRLWYKQAGTPLVTVKEEYLPEEKIYRLHLEQDIPDTPNQTNKKPMHMPMRIGILKQNGSPIPIVGEGVSGEETATLSFKDKSQTFTFNQVPEKPVLSIGRGFSSAVKYDINQTPEELATLLAHDPDAFNAWDAGQRLLQHEIHRLYQGYRAKETVDVDKQVISSLSQVLKNETLNPALKAEVFTLPALSYLLDLWPGSDIESLYQAHHALTMEIAHQLKGELLKQYEQSQLPGLYAYTPEDAASRRLKNVCLHYLVKLEDKESIELGKKQYQKANNMTDALGALAAMNHIQGDERQSLLNEFYERWQNDPLVVNKWLRLQAGSQLASTFEEVQRLMLHEAFDIKNPNKVYALIGGFAANTRRFHDSSGDAYTFLADCVIELNEINPQVAARMMQPFTHWKKLDAPRAEKMKQAIERVFNQKDLCKDVYEIAMKCLKSS